MRGRESPTALGLPTSRVGTWADWISPATRLFSDTPSGFFSLLTTRAYMA